MAGRTSLWRDVLLWIHLNARSEKAMAPHSSTLVWKIPWMDEPARLRSMGLLRVGHDWATSLSLFTCMHWRRKCNPLQCSCLENPRDREPGGLPSMGSHRVGHDWRDWAAAAAANARWMLKHKVDCHYKFQNFISSFPLLFPNTQRDCEKYILRL